jgi:predicted nucleic acid-binding protein
VECVSALALDQRAETLALDRLNQLASGWHEVDPTDLVRETAMRFLRVHPLRAADALQLAAAFIAAEQRPASLEMLTFDDRLANAARKEGFAVIDIATD